MFTPAERTDMIHQLEALPAQLSDALRGLSPEQMDTPYGPGKWTVRQVVHHLADAHMHAFLRCKFALTEEHPMLKTYEQDDWAATIDANSGPVEPSVEIVRGIHARWVRLFSSLDESAWKRTANHPENGSMPLETFLKIYSNHGRKHIGHIMGLRQAKGW